MFKKILKWIGIFLLGMLLLIAAMAIWTSVKKSEYEETAVPYIKEVIPKISQWNPEFAKQFLVAETLENASDEDLAKLFRWFSKLGNLVSLEEPEFVQVYSGTTVRDGANTIVTYTVLGHYANGDANITIKLLDLGDSFEVYLFNVNSTALLD